MWKTSFATGCVDVISEANPLIPSRQASISSPLARASKAMRAAAKTAIAQQMHDPRLPSESIEFPKSATIPHRPETLKIARRVVSASPRPRPTGRGVRHEEDRAPGLVPPRARRWRLPCGRPPPLQPPPVRQGARRHQRSDVFCPFRLTTSQSTRCIRHGLASWGEDITAPNLNIYRAGTCRGRSSFSQQNSVVTAAGVQGNPPAPLPGIRLSPPPHFGLAIYEGAVAR